MIEFHLEDLDSKFRDYLNSHQDQEFLVKLYWDEYEDHRRVFSKKIHIGFTFVHSAVLKIFLNNLPRDFLQGL